MRNARFRGVAAGEQLGNLEYLIDDDVMAEYRALVGDCGNYANLIADDCESMAVAPIRHRRTKLTPGADLISCGRRYRGAASRPADGSRSFGRGMAHHG